MLSDQPDVGGGYAVGEVPEWSKAPKPMSPASLHDGAPEATVQSTGSAGAGQFDRAARAHGRGRPGQGYAGLVFEYVVPDGDAGYGIAAGRLLFIGSTAFAPRIPALWRTISAPDARLDDLFDVVTAPGVSTAPDFVMAEIVDGRERTVRALVHGSAVAQADGDAATRLSGSGLSTWRESTWVGPEAIMLGLISTGPGIETLPLTTGVVRTNWLRWRSGLVSGPPEPTGRVDPAEARARTRRARPAATPPGPGIPAVRLADGPPLPLDLPIVLGRRPAAGLSERGLPTVPIDVPSPKRLVSAQHLLIERADGDVRLRDLDTTNGSRVLLADGTAQVLRGGAELTVPIGTRIELGDGNIIEIIALP